MKRLFHVSPENLDGKVLFPKVPDNFLVRCGAEDGSTPRVCLAASIGDCLKGMGKNLEGREFFVHAAKGSSQVVRPDASMVPDAPLTGELWSLEPVALRFCCKTLVLPSDGLPVQEYAYRTREGKWC